MHSPFSCSCSGQVSALEERFGWVDYNATNAALALTLADTPYDIPNDGLGEFTLKDYKPAGHGEIWDATLNQFDFSSLKLGDRVLIRYDLIFNPSQTFRELQLNMNLAIGHANAYSLPVFHQDFKHLNATPIAGLFLVYMGNDFTLENPAKFTAQSDGVGDTLDINGWYVETMGR